MKGGCDTLVLMEISHLSYVLGHIFKDGWRTTQDDTIIVADDIAGVKGDGQFGLLNNIQLVVKLANKKLTYPSTPVWSLIRSRASSTADYDKRRICKHNFAVKRRCTAACRHLLITHLPLWAMMRERVVWLKRRHRFIVSILNEKSFHSQKKASKIRSTQERKQKKHLSLLVIIVGLVNSRWKL